MVDCGTQTQRKSVFWFTHPSIHHGALVCYCLTLSPSLSHYENNDGVELRGAAAREKKKLPEASNACGRDEAFGSYHRFVQ